MYRAITEDLLRWKDKSNHKPLIIQGARRVGKTTLIRDFGSKNYKETVYINLENNRRMSEFFSGDLNVERLIMGIELYYGFKIIPEKTLIFFDEVQTVPRVLLSLANFHRDASEYNIICACSHWDDNIFGEESFSKGDVEILSLYPLTFKEFLIAMKKDYLATALSQKDYDRIECNKAEYIEYLKYYFYVGGMPQAVSCFVEKKDFYEVWYIQKEILESYEQDILKHSPRGITPKIQSVWSVLPKQLSREKKKFVYDLLQNGARAKDYVTSVFWLMDSGLAYKVNRIDKPERPLYAFEDSKAFKLFPIDVGLLGHMLGLQPHTLLDGNDVFAVFNEALTQHFVLQEMTANGGVKIYYYTNNRGASEIEFVADDGVRIIPIEVSGELNLQAKSLKVYREKYNPEIAIRVNLGEYGKENGTINVPVYML